MTRTGTFATPHASKYLQQLLKHFAHKVEVSFTETEGTAAMQGGTATLTATPELLSVTIVGDSDAVLDQTAHIIDVHLERFAFREDFKNLNWAATAA